MLKEKKRESTNIMRNKTVMFGFSVASGELGRMDLREAEREEYLERRKERKK